jgi:putative methionine-R-sulfoxide reductase with GAF domain
VQSDGGHRLEVSTTARGIDAVAQVAALVGHVHEREPEEAAAVLDELLASAVHYVPGAQYAGITAIDRGGRIDTLAATGDYPGLLDVIQRRHQQGPCLQAIRENHTVRADDLTGEIRWPHFRCDALAHTPIRSMLSFPMATNGHLLSALNFYAEYPHTFDADSEDLGLVYVTYAALAWTALRRDEQSRSALASRDLIGQAKGIIMERFNIDAVQAFELLKRLSQESNTAVTQISRRLIDADRPDS